ncbi:MAG TPA: choice-of-anchor B family protein [Bacteroidia bacterium]|nr:choice-of-anchor B family protein [Bacteroidia bacterium]
MKKGLRLKIAAASLFVTAGLFAQSNLNVTLADQLATPGGQTLANICGYTAPNGNEYALLGGESGMIIVDITVPTNVVQIVQIPMVASLWKEIKVYQNYAFVTTEGSGGALQIVDLSAIPATTPGAYTFHTYTGDGSIAGQLSTVHALHIDTTKGFCYLFGTNIGAQGAIFLDLNTDPYNPTYAGRYDQNGYVHDGYVDNDTLYAGHIYAGTFAIVDCTNKSAPNVLSITTTPTAFTHNTWLSDDRNYLFTTDENTNSFLASYDISNPGNIQELDRIQSWNPNSGSIVHNTHILNNWAVTSWYRDGFVITDVTRPHNLVHVGWYDTYNGSGNGFNGDWGVFPFFNSGTIVCSNIDEGLFVFSPTYVRACYLEGTAYDSLCGTPLTGVTVNISTVNVTTTTNINGEFATGTPTPGTYTVTFSKPGYQTVVYNNVAFVPGQVNFFNVAMYSPGGFTLNGHVEDATSTTAIPAVPVQVSNASNSYLFTSDGSGDFTNCTVIPGWYDVAAAAWGYEMACYQDSATATSGLLNIQLDSGYEDEFTFDLGWTVVGNASSGSWERGEPIGTTYNNPNDANPDADVNNDCTDKCYVTGNGGGSASQDDVDNGNTVLTSPLMDLSTYGDAWVHYSRWFFNDGGSGNPNDTMYIRVENGSDTVVLEKVHRNSANNSSWVNRSYRLQNYITVTSTMRLIVEVRDFAGGHLVEGAFDNFMVADSNALSVQSPSLAEGGMSVYPNPFNGNAQVTYSIPAEQAGSAYIEVVDMAGRVVSVTTLTNANGTVSFGSELAEGVYMVRLVGSEGLLDQERIVKTK